MVQSLVKNCFEEGGSIHPLLIDPEITKHLSLCNTSILELDKDSKYLLNIRWVSYYLHHCEKDQKYQTAWGPLNYVRPDVDQRLRTENYICDLDLQAMAPLNPRKIDESKFDPPAEWDFVGAEDVRLTMWEGQLYGSSVRRFTPNGEGRMQVSKLNVTSTSAVEEERFYIEAPVDPNAYCEKNWMPVLDDPLTYVKWCSPIEVVKANLDTTDTSTQRSPSTMVTTNEDRLAPGIEARGGSQVVTYKGYYIALIHELVGWHNKKNDRDAFYFHRFIVWDKKWNLVDYSDRFTFMHGRIEFCCGLASYKDSFLMTFGFQDNGAYLFKMPKHYLDKLVKL
jgi:hypothetical protein